MFNVCYYVDVFSYDYGGDDILFIYVYMIDISYLIRYYFFDFFCCLFLRNDGRWKLEEIYILIVDGCLMRIVELFSSSSEDKNN